MLYVVAIAAGLAVLFCIWIIGWCATRIPLTPEHKRQIERMQTTYTVVLIVAAVLLGCALERLIP